MKPLTKTTIVIMLALSAQAAGFARRLRSPAGNMCNIRGGSGVYYHSRDSAKEGGVPKASKNYRVFGPISAVGTTSCLLIARASAGGRSPHIKGEPAAGLPRERPGCTPRLFF
jgi:hypothetical protein